MDCWRRALVVLSAAALAACNGGGGPATGGPPTTISPQTLRPSVAPTTTPTTAPSARPDYLLVAIGDSIPFNSPEDCPGCTGFVSQYGDALAAATGKSVGILNRSDHTGLTVDRLLLNMKSRSVQMELADADAIIVGIAHNDVPMGRDDDSCDGPFSESPDWSKFTDACIKTELERFRPKYEAVYKQIAELRAGKPTILLTINRYNDWNGWPGHDLSATGLKVTVQVIAAWNDAICGAAEAQGFICVDLSTAFNGEEGRIPSDGLLAADYTHPSQRGNDLITRLLVDAGFAPLAGE
jgi:lysophospholipase L1-like esterase